ncbi:MAG TPA: hypothetical protein VKH36_03890, partial [Acidimicrobiia bacterium]|nr:hypothetical protein [Acidimicrobiia bacterium]
MSEGIRRVFEAVDYDELVREFPPPPEYFETAWRASPEAIERVQLRRLRERARAATHVPFFAKRWEAAGFDADSIANSTWRALLVTLPALAVITTQFSHRCSASSNTHAPLCVPYSHEL